MTPEIKVIHVSQRLAKNGNKYQIVHAVITINGQEFVRKFYLFGNESQEERLLRKYPQSDDIPF